MCAMWRVFRFSLCDENGRLFVFRETIAYRIYFAQGRLLVSY